MYLPYIALEFSSSNVTPHIWHILKGIKLLNNFGKLGERGLSLISHPS